MLDEYLEQNYDKLKDIAYNIAGFKYYEDLLHLVIEELYKTDYIKLKETIEQHKMEFFVVRIMLNQYYSETSRFYYKYKKYYKHHTKQVIENITQDTHKNDIAKKQLVEDRLAWIEEKLKDIYWFDAEVFRIYYRESFSLSEMAKATKISRATLYKAITNVKNYLKNEL